jgi:hypothetical protein
MKRPLVISKVSVRGEEEYESAEAELIERLKMVREYRKSQGVR